MENKKEDIPIHDTKNVDTAIDLPENEVTTLNEQDTTVINAKKGKIVTDKNEALENPPPSVHKYTPSQEKV
jgi:hypothetical protein